MKKTFKKTMAVLCAALMMSASVPFSNSGNQTVNAINEGCFNPEASNFYMCRTTYFLREKLNCTDMYAGIGKNIFTPVPLGGDGFIFAERHANTAGGRGFLVYGPYKKYPAGKMVASFHMKQDIGTDYGVNNAIVRVEAYDATADRILSYKDVYRCELEDSNHKCEYKSIRLPFYNVSSNHKLEFRIYFYANAAIWTDTISIFCD